MSGEKRQNLTRCCVQISSLDGFFSGVFITLKSLGEDRVPPGSDAFPINGLTLSPRQLATDGRGWGAVLLGQVPRAEKPMAWPVPRREVRERARGLQCWRFLHFSSSCNQQGRSERKWKKPWLWNTSCQPATELPKGVRSEERRGTGAGFLVC